MLKNPNKIGSLAKFSIWNKEHIKDYLKRINPHVWILRTYKLNKPYMAEKNLGIKYANLKKSIELSNAEPVLSDHDFEMIKKHIINI